MPVQITDQDGKHALISGYGLLFGDNGSGMPPLTRETDLMLSLVPRKPVLFEHNSPAARGDIRGTIGEEAHITLDDRGIWLDALIDLSVPGVADLLPEIEAEKIGFSPGAFPTLVAYEPGRMLCFPIMEWSLSRNPKDWRLMYRRRVNHELRPLMFIAQNGKVYDPAGGRIIEPVELIEFQFFGQPIHIYCEDSSLMQPAGFTTLYVSE